MSGETEPQDEQCTTDDGHRPWLLGLREPLDEQSPVWADDSSTPGKPADGQSEQQCGTTLPEDTLGVALSGGGIRSATFCLGVVQSLARGRWLRHVDYLSTVSGGGYTGAFLGRFFDGCAKPGGIGGAIPISTPGAAQARVRKDLSDSRSAPVQWLRRHSNYLAPTGTGEGLFNVATFWRNFLSLHFVLAALFLAIFGSMGAIGYSERLGRVIDVFEGNFSSLIPITGLLHESWATAWAGLTELALWLAVVPLMVAYWAVSQDRHEAFVVSVIVIAAVVAIAILLGWGSPLALAILAAVVAWAGLAWGAIRRREGQGNPHSRFRMALARNYLTYSLAFWISATLALAGLTLVDGLGQWLARQMLEDGLSLAGVGSWLGSMTGAVLALAPVLRWIAQLLAESEEPAKQPGKAARFILRTPYLAPLLVLVIGAFLPLVLFSFVTHTVYGIGYSWGAGVVFTAMAIIISLLLGTRESAPFVNRSGPLMIYAARLCRAFLGAVNPGRREHPRAEDVTYVVPGDDLPIDHYSPHAAGGPLHLINCAVNETVDVASERGQRDRQAENLAVGPAGVSIADRWHALWKAPPEPEPGKLLDRMSRPSRRLEAIGVRNGRHPLLGKEREAVPVEGLNLRQWIAISGAALSPGMGRHTDFAHALLFTLANLRLGYWWDSGLWAEERYNLPSRAGIFRSVTRRLQRVLRAQGLILSELRGRFAGPWERFWHLSDGGFFENTGAYELLRRRVPFVILVDAGRDVEHQSPNLAALERIARIDFGAQFTDMTEAFDGSLENLGVPPEVVRRLGGLNDLCVPEGGIPKRHAALLRVRYSELAASDASAWNGRSATWLLYIKANCTGDETTDISHYRAVHPQFPHESTVDQFFDEPQWESYRMLGDHIGTELFT